MFESINLFEELMMAKEIKKAEIVLARGWRRSAPGVKVWYDDVVKIYVFNDSMELSDFIKDLNDLGIECKSL